MGARPGTLVVVFALALPSWVTASNPQHEEPAIARDASVQASPRVRGSSPAIAAAVAQALEQSPTFAKVVTDIDATNGIVYVHYGTCGRNVLACLLLAVTQAGQHRIA